MLWYNSPESVKAIHDGRCDGTMSEHRRLMRIVRTDGQHTQN